MDSHRDANGAGGTLALPATTDSHAQTLLRIQSAVLAHERFAAAAAALTNEMAAAWSIDCVYVGMVEGDTVEVVAVSRTVTPSQQAGLLRAVANAMHEAAEQAVTLVFPAPSAGQPRVTVAHAELDRQSGGWFCTIPLAAGGRVFGAVTLQRARDDALSPAEIAACEQVCALIGPILRLHRAGDLPWHRRVRETTHAGWTRLTGAGHWVSKGALAALVIVVAGVLFFPVEYWVGATARIEGAVQRVLVAPVDGFVGKVSARPGDRVSAGQVLVELAEQDLQLERRKWESELAQHENARHAALARGDRGQYAISQAKADGARAQLALVEEQIGRARVSAPFDAVVIKGDLTQSIGAPVQRGQVLLTVAPANEYRLIVEVDERDIPDVQPGAAGALALAALPDHARSFKVARITPVAIARDGRNFFEVEGTLGGLPSSVQPGLQGVAKIQAGRRSLAWIWTHRFVDWLRLTLWTWRI